MNKNPFVFTLLAFLLFACTPSTLTPAIETLTETIRTPTSAQSALADTPSAGTSIPEHRIGIRLVAGVGEFYDRQTGEVFVPRGTNYVRIAWQNNNSIFYHSTFNPGLYDPEAADEALQQMQKQGYNAVRVFLNHCCISGSLGDPQGGLSLAYVSNVADFLDKAKAHQIYVFLAIDDTPKVGGYIEVLDTTWSENFSGTNNSILRQGGILANSQFWVDLIRELAKLNAPIDVIFAYGLRNELFFESNLPPLSLDSGVFSTANGKSYDMASQDDKQRMMDEGLVYWIDQVRAAILEVDPTALVTVGFFQPQGPNPSRQGDPRLIRTYPAIFGSSMDFVDLHPYPDAGLTLSQFVANFEMQDMQEKPIVMGEFGGHKDNYGSLTHAARVFRDWQIESCIFGFDGWLFWTWDTEEQPEFYNETSNERLINQMLAPAFRLDPCSEN